MFPVAIMAAITAARGEVIVFVPVVLSCLVFSVMNPILWIRSQDESYFFKSLCAAVLMPVAGLSLATLVGEKNPGDGIILLIFPMGLAFVFYGLAALVRLCFGADTAV